MAPFLSRLWKATAWRLGAAGAWVCVAALAETPSPTALVETFTQAVWEGDRWATSGSGMYLTIEGTQTVFDSGRGADGIYRYVSLSCLSPMDGDFRAEFAIEARQLDYWNHVAFAVSALDGTWSVQLQREQRNAGEHFLTTAIARGGKPEERRQPQSSR